VTRAQRLALLGAILASTIVTVDSFAVNVALPAIRRDLGGGFAAQQWIANGYLLTLGALILLAGSLTDRLGERRVFTLGVAGFGLVSLVCAAAPSIGVLIAARALQGVAGALLTPAALAIIVAVFPPEVRGAAIGRWTAWSGIGILVGPLLGGEIVDIASWRWIFAINPPLVLAALALARVAVPGNRARSGAGPVPRLDWTGAALAAAGLAGVSFALIEQPVLGWSDPAIWGALGAGVLLFAGFVRYEARARAPMLPLALFARRGFSVANAQTVAMYGGLSLLTFFQSIYLQQVAGWSALKAGSTGLLPTGVMFLLSSRIGRLADRLGPRAFLTVGPLVVALGFALMLRYGASVSMLGDVLPALLVFGLGLALTVSPLTATVLGEVPDSSAGIASAINNAIARTAGLIAVAAVGAVVAAHYAGSLRSELGNRLPRRSHPAVIAAERRTFAAIDARALPAADRPLARRASRRASEDAFHLAAGIGAGLLVIAGIGGGVGLRSPRHAPVVAP
jgi:EmrB/QacA subfamily drug resistance transporter